MSSPDADNRSNRPTDLCETVCRHLAWEREYLEEIRRCVLDWPASLVPSAQMDDSIARMAELEVERDGLQREREQLLRRLQLAFGMPMVRRLTAFAWGEREGEQLEESLREVRRSVARLAGGVRASSRTLSYWSEAVARLLAGVTGEDPRAGMYSSAGKRADYGAPLVRPAKFVKPASTRKADSQVPNS